MSEGLMCFSPFLEHSRSNHSLQFHPEPLVRILVDRPLAEISARKQPLVSESVPPVLRRAQLVIKNKEERWIGHRLNILGIRVYRGACFLVARTDDAWMTLGPSRRLPVQVPRNAE